MKYRYPFLALAIVAGFLAYWAGVPGYWVALLVVCPLMMILMMSWSAKNGDAR